MNKTAIKNFAIRARNKLRADITLNVGLLGITEDGIAEPLPQSTEDMQIFDIGTSQPVRIEGKTAIEQREALANAIRSKNLQYPEAFDAVIEEVAYTWFNRLIAVRFMEINDYLPNRVRVLSSENPAKAEPDFVTNPYDNDFDFTEEELDYIDELKNHNRSDELFQFLFIKQCNKLNEILPELFEKTNDYTELLLNVSFTDKDGIIRHLVHDIDEDDFNIEKEGQVEIIGWLYQYYNTEPKDKVFSRPSGQKIRKEDVPAATQLFTPDWIVRYMVENSLGRIYVNSLECEEWSVEFEKSTAEAMGWKYYLPEAEQTEEVKNKLHPQNSKFHTPNSTLFLDPCMGSGHILVYAFDVFMDIYTALGYSEKDAAQEIVKNNLYGLELDDRAAQLAYFAVMMKARSYDRRFLTRGIRPNLCSIKESNNFNSDCLELFKELKPTAQKLVDEFIDAKEYGSILNLKITPEELADLQTKFEEIKSTEYCNFFDASKKSGILTDFYPLLVQAQIMIKKYDAVCTNPPYMGGSGMNAKLSAYVKKNYPDSKADLFAVFMEKCVNYTAKDCYTAMITMHSWMFLSSFEKLRNKLLLQTNVNMAHLGARAFDQISGEVVQTTAFVNKKEKIESYLSTYKRLIEPNSENAKREAFLSGEFDYIANEDNFSKIPGAPVAYWVSEKTIHAFENKSFSCRFISGGRNKTHNNEKYVRTWWEIYDRIKWQGYSNGGNYRKWYGNNTDVVDWSSSAKLFYETHGGLLKESFWNIPAITWNDITSGKSSYRIKPIDCKYSSVSPTLIGNREDYDYSMLGFLNSIVCEYISTITNPTLHTLVGNILLLPDLITNIDVDSTVKENITLSKADWDSFETSWDFKKHPLI